MFADAGAHVTIVGRDGGVSVGYLIADIFRPQECARMADEVMAARGAIDVLCANAGMFTGKKPT